MKRSEIILLVTLALIQFTNITDFMIMMPLGTQLMEMFHITPAQFSILVASYAIMSGIMGFAGLFFLDRFDRKKLLMITYAGFVIGTFACALANSYSMLLLARILTGMFGGILSAQILAIVGDSFHYERRAFAMSFVTMAFGFASIVGVPLGLYSAATFTWHIPFFGIGSFGCIIFVVMNFSIPGMKGHLHHASASSGWNALTSILKNSNQMMALFFMVALVIGQFTIIPFLAPYMEYNVGFTKHQLTYIYLLGGTVTLLFMPFIGKAADKYGKARIFIISAFFSIIPLFIITNLPQVSVALALTVTSIFFIFISGRMTPAMTLMTGTVTPERRGGFMSIVSCVQMLASGLAAFLAGNIVHQLSDKSLQCYAIAGYIAIGSTLVAIYIAAKLKVSDTRTTVTVS